MRRSRELRIAVAVLTLPALAITVPGFLPDRVFLYGDWLHYFLPMRLHMIDAWQAGQALPLWWSEMLGGFPIHANPQYGLFYPPHWLLAVLSANPGLAILAWGHMVWGGLGMVVLLRGRGAGRAPALLGGFVFALSGPMMSAASAVNLAEAAAWMPWVLHWFPLGLDSHGRGPRRAAAGALAAMFLTGGLEPLIWIVLLLPFWSYASSHVFQGSVVGLRLPMRRSRRIGPVLLGLIVIGGAALAMSAVQLLPTLELVGRSTRVVSLGPAAPLQFVSSPGRMAALFVPWASWDPATMTSWIGLTGEVRAHYLPVLFVGLTPLVLACTGWLRSPRGERGMMTMLGIFTLLLGTSAGLPVIGTIAELVPGSAYWRYSEKYLLLFALALAWFTAWGLQGALERRETLPGDRPTPIGRLAHGPLLIVVSAAGLLGAFLTLFLGPPIGRLLLALNGQSLAPDAADALAGYARAQALGLGMTAVVAMGAGLVLRGAWRMRIAAGLAGVVVLFGVGLEYTVVTRGLFRTTSLTEARRAEAPARSVLAAGIAGRLIRWDLDEELTAPRTLLADPDLQTVLYKHWMVAGLGPLQGIPTVGGSSALRLATQSYAEGSWRGAGADVRLPFAGALGARFLLFADPRPARRLMEAQGAVPIYPTGLAPPDTAAGVPPPVVLFNRNSLQPIQMVYDWRRAPDPFTAVDRLRGTGLRPDRQVVLSPGPGEALADSTLLPAPPASGIPATEPRWQVRVLARDSQSLVLQVETPEPGILIRTENPYPGWVAEVDRKETPVWWANAVLQAVAVPEGSHEVRFIYRPGALIPGALLSLLGLFWVAFPGMRSLMLRRRSARAFGAPDGAIDAARRHHD
ncbi:hypothetical protein ACFL4Y_02500 [Gemmatimonadota bacterium]